MEENLNTNITTILIIEIVSFILGLIFDFIDSPFLAFWLFSTVIINTIAVFFLAKYKTKLYLLAITIALLIIFIPIFYILYMFSKIQC
jgi:hypothetical protein